MKYRIRDNPTVYGEPAGWKLDNYLEFQAGDIVELGDDEPTVVEVFKDGLGQTIDFDSLERLS